MNDVTDLRIRRALAEIVDTAPMVRPLEQFLPFTRAVAGAGRRTHRGPALVVGLLAAALLAALIFWPRDDGPRRMPRSRRSQCAKSAS